jgi:hypothetical protein
MDNYLECASHSIGSILAETGKDKEIRGKKYLNFRNTLNFGFEVKHIEYNVGKNVTIQLFSYNKENQMMLYSAATKGVKGFIGRCNLSEWSSFSNLQNIISQIKNQCGDLPIIVMALNSQIHKITENDAEINEFRQWVHDSAGILIESENEINFWGEWRRNNQDLFQNFIENCIKFTS